MAYPLERNVSHHKPSPSELSDKRDRQKRMNSNFSNALSSLTYLRNVVENPTADRATTTEELVKQMAEAEQQLFTEVDPALIKGKKKDHVSPSPGSGDSPQKGVVEHKNTAYIASLKDRQHKNDKPFVIGLTPLPLDWDYARPKSALTEKAAGNYTGLFKPGVEKPSFDIPEEKNRRKQIQLAKEERVKGFIPPSKAPKFKDPEMPNTANPPKISGVPKCAADPPRHPRDKVMTASHPMGRPFHI